MKERETVTQREGLYRVKKDENSGARRSVQYFQHFVTELYVYVLGCLCLSMRVVRQKFPLH